MASTNAAKIQDPEKQALASISSELSTSSTALNDDRSSEEETDDPTESKMSKLQHIFLCCVLLAIFTFTVASAAANGALKAVSLEERLRFQELLDTVEPAALHEVLHEQLKDKYQHGVYQEDKTAMEAVHQTNAEVAQSLVELAKRQTNSTASSTPQSSTSVPTPESSTSQAVTNPSTSETTSQQQTSQAPPTTTPAVQSSQTVDSTTTPGTTSAVPSSSTPTKASSTPTTSTTTKRASSTNGSPPVSNSSGTSLPSSDLPVSSNVSPSPSVALSSSRGSSSSASSPTGQQASTTSTSATTRKTSSVVKSSSNRSTAPSTSVTPPDTSVSPTTSRSVTQQIVYTTTLANGAPTTVTSVTVVPADQADKTGGSATKTNPSASLQTNGANAGHRFGLTGILGAIGVVVVGAL